MNQIRVQKCGLGALQVPRCNAILCNKRTSLKMVEIGQDRKLPSCLTLVQKQGHR